MTDSDELYERLADFYTTGEYTLYSERMAHQFQDTLTLFDADGDRVLDVACGEGSFATSIAEEGFDVTGIDASESMIDIARQNAAESDATPDFHVMKAENLDLSATFDVVTCWFDSLNHLLEIDDVEAVFERVYDSLEVDGLFVFDVNSISRLAERGEKDPTVVRDTDDRFEAYTNLKFDDETNLLTQKITCFEKDGDRWERFDGVVRERGYAVADLEDALRRVGFEDLTTTRSLCKIEAPDSTDRIYFAARKRA